MSGPKLCTRCVFNQFLLSYKVVWICSYQSSGSASFHICLFPPPPYFKFICFYFDPIPIRPLHTFPFRCCAVHSHCT